MCNVAALFGRGAVAFRARLQSSLRRSFKHRWLRRSAVAIAAVLLVAALGCGAVSWRLTRGPISLDPFTPVFAAAIQKNFGDQQRVDVGGTTIERDKNGHTSLRLVDVVLHDRDGAAVASAAKVEVGISLLGLLMGNLHATSLRLVEAEISVRIAADGKIAVSTGGNSRPLAIATAPMPVPRPSTAVTPKPSGAPADARAAPSLWRDSAQGFGALLAWIDSLGHGGLDGHDLSEIGLLDGTLDVDDRREGHHWTFNHIDVSLKRPRAGGIEFAMRSDDSGRSWALRAIAQPSEGDRRAVTIDAKRVPAKDLLLALRFADLPFNADFPISARVRGVIEPNGAPDMLRGAIVAEGGTITGSRSAQQPISIEHAAINFEWNAERRMLLVPMQITAGGNRYTLLAQVDVPVDANAPWRVQLGGGSAVLTSGAASDPPLVLNRILAHAQLDFVHRRIDLLQADLGNSETRVALSGSFDYSGRPRLMLGLAARPMSLATFRALWPASVNRNVRKWVDTHVEAATVERVDIAVNAPLDTLVPSGPPVPTDGLSISLQSTATTLKPIDSLPAIGKADLDVHVSGRNVLVKVGHATVVLPSGRKLGLSQGTFEVPDVVPKPTPSQTHFHLDGTVAAAAELLSLDGLRDASGAPLDAASSHGKLSAQVALGMALSEDLGDSKVAYTVDANFTNFSAEHMIAGQRLEAADLHAHADNQGYHVKGDVKIGGTPASLDYQKQFAVAGADLRVQASLDEKTRSRFGIDLGSGLSGTIPITLNGHISDVQDGRFAVEADLTPASVDQLLPGWVKAPGKSAHASFTLTTSPSATRLDDLRLDGLGILMRGNVLLDPAGKLSSASFPVFSPTSGDKASLKVERAGDGTIHVTLHGDVYDGRQFVKSVLAGPSLEQRRRQKIPNLDLDVKLGIIVGFQGEALRSVDLKLSRRNGQIRRFTLLANIGRDAQLRGGLRARDQGRRDVVLTTNDAGALFRFTDIYAHLAGGRLSVSMDAPSSDDSPQQGTLNVDNFVVRGEAALNRVVAGIAPAQESSINFTAMAVDFTRSPGRLSIHDGVVRGPVIGATIDGLIDYRRENVRMRGTFVPLYGLNNMFGRLPILGPLLGGNNEGLVGITYEVIGSPSAPMLRVNPISAVAPGFIRKIFEFPNGGASGGVSDADGTR